MADPTFIHYYQRELAYLRALGEEFIEAYPEIAYVMGERGDPAAERLFQGAALLTARVRLRIEDDLPEISHPFVSRMWPQFLRPIPAVTLISFRPTVGAVGESLLLPRGTTVASAPTASRPSFVFRTTSDLPLLPGAIESVSVARQRAGDLQLRVRLSVDASQPAASGAKERTTKFRLQFMGEEPERYTLYEWVSRATRVTLEDPKGAVLCELPPEGICLVGMSPEEALWPSTPTHLPGLDLLEEYFVCPEKFLGVEVGLHLPSNVTDFDLVFHLGLLPDPGFEVDASLMALGCVPAVNLVQHCEVEIKTAPGPHRFRLDAGGDLFEIEQLTAYDRETHEYREVPRLGTAGAIGTGQIHYEVIRLEEGVDGLQTYLLLVDEEGRPTPSRTNSLRVRLSRTDGALPGQLGRGTVTQHSGGTPGIVTFTNLLPVRPGRQRSLHQGHLWRLFAMLTMHPFDLCSVNGLQTILQELNAGGRRHVLMDLRTNLSSTLYRRTAVPLRQVEMAFEDASFAAPGQLRLFARVVSRLFGPTPGSIMFTEVTVRGEPSGAEHRFSFGPISGGGDVIQ